MKRALVTSALAFALVGFISSCSASRHKHPKDNALVDPVCNKKLTNLVDAYSGKYRGETYFFHSESCRDRFAANPKKYLASK